MTPDEILTQLEAELARCRDERDGLGARLEVVIDERERAELEIIRLDRMLLSTQRERDWLRGELLSVLESRSWSLTRPLRRALGSDRPEAAEPR
jgi:hypothetical protein